MLSQEQAVEIKVLARRGLGVREIARQTGISRNTVRRYLRDEQAGHYKPCDGQHRWNTQLLALAETYGFTPKVCRPYRAKTKGKVERFNRYLKESFVVPLAATLKQSGLTLDVDAANAHIGRRLTEIANVRVHATTRAPGSEADGRDARQAAASRAHRANQR
ncbi:hypothetical protein WM09_20020 [Burkholderia ubonensis]|nr:hypothetical protein WM09_20020 [Burkholderia ubonensis]